MKLTEREEQEKWTIQGFIMHAAKLKHTSPEKILLVHVFMIQATYIFRKKSLCKYAC